MLFNVRQWNIIQRGPVRGMHFKAYQTPKTPPNSLYHWPTGFYTSVILLSLLADSTLSHHTALFWQRCLYWLPPVHQWTGSIPFNERAACSSRYRLSDTSRLITEVMLEVWKPRLVAWLSVWESVFLTYFWPWVWRFHSNNEQNNWKCTTSQLSDVFGNWSTAASRIRTLVIEVVDGSPWRSSRPWESVGLTNRESQIKKKRGWLCSNVALRSNT